MTTHADTLRALANSPRWSAPGFITEVSNVARAALRAAADREDAIRDALSRHPKCEEHPDGDVITCGWKSAVRDITHTVNELDQEQTR
jgi:hypothetical protein